MVVAIIATLVAGYANFTDASQIMGMSAKALVQVQNVALSVYNKMGQLEMKDLVQKMADFQNDAQEKMKELQELKDQLAIDKQLLDNALWVAPSRSELFINLGESAEDYYTRTIHTGNIGVNVIDVTLNSVENMLKLPTAQVTLQQNQGGF